MTSNMIALLIIIILIAYLRPCEEGFATKKDKAKSIYAWFNNNPNPKYTVYKKEVEQSNIVEYEDILALSQNHKLSLDAVEEAI